MRQIVFIRHGKAQPKLWPQDTPEDHTNRHLTNLGIMQAQDVGAWLAARSIKPDHILCSTATRATETAKHVLLGMDIETVPTTFHDEIYYKDVADIMRIINSAPASANTLFVVGHNPTIPETAQYMDGGNNRDLYQQFYRQYGLCGTCHLSVEGEWTAQTSGSARLTAYYEPSQDAMAGNTSASAR